MARANGAAVVGPNTAGLVTPGACFVGFMPAFEADVFRPGRVGVISRSGSLGSLICLNLVQAGFGQSAFIGIGGDPIVGTTSRDALEQLDADEGTDAVVIVGEIGGAMEEDAAEYAQDMQQAGRRLHRGQRRACGQEDGARRRHRDGREGHLCVETRGAGGGGGDGARHPVRGRARAQGGTGLSRRLSGRHCRLRFGFATGGRRESHDGCEPARGASRPEGSLLRPLAHHAHRRPGRGAALSRLLHPRSGGAFVLRGDRLPPAARRASHAGRARQPSTAR